MGLALRPRHRARPHHHGRNTGRHRPHRDRPRPGEAPVTRVPPVIIEEHPVADSAAEPYALTTGPDGALWFTLVHSGRIGRFVPGREPTSHRLAPDSGPTVITPGPDGALWFTEHKADRIGRITTDGVIDEFDLPTPGCGPFGIAAGPDGALWTALEIGALARVTPADSTT
ncbi:Vgb family protein [Streptomyces cinereoruber]